MSVIRQQQTFPVELGMYFNWKGISWPEHGIIGQVDPHGSSLPGEALPNNTTVTIRNIPYRIPMTDSVADDLISCEGQRIVLPCASHIQAVLILGFSVFGDYAERMGLYYEDSDVAESREFGLSDWFQYLPDKPAHFDEEEGIVIPYFLDDEGVAERPVAIWTQQIPANPQWKLSELELPDNPFMYIMAITLIAS